MLSAPIIWSGAERSSNKPRSRCTLSVHKWEGHWKARLMNGPFTAADTFPSGAAVEGKKAPKADTALFLNHNKHDANQYVYATWVRIFNGPRAEKNVSLSSLDLTRTNVKSPARCIVALFVTLSAICHTNNTISWSQCWIIMYWITRVRCVLFEWPCSDVLSQQTSLPWRRHFACQTKNVLLAPLFFWLRLFRVCDYDHRYYFIA